MKIIFTTVSLAASNKDSRAEARFFPPMNQWTPPRVELKRKLIFELWKIVLGYGARRREIGIECYAPTIAPTSSPSSSARARPLKRDGARKRRERAVARLGNGRKGACPLADIARDISWERGERDNESTRDK